MKNAVMTAAVAEKLAANAIEPSGIAPAAFGAWIRADIQKFREAIRTAGLEPH
jgi:tripartite-type tricarboxylate transporter receptor subunit TctC